MLFQAYFSELECKILNIMGIKVSLSANDVKTMTKRLAEGSSAIEISKELKRDPRTVKNKMPSIFLRTVQSDKGKSMFLPRNMKTVKKLSLCTSKTILEGA